MVADGARLLLMPKSPFIEIRTILSDNVKLPYCDYAYLVVLGNITLYIYVAMNINTRHAFILF